MDTISMISKNSKKFDPHRLFLSLSDKTNLKRSDKYLAFSNLSIYYRSKISASSGAKTLNYLMDYILYQIFKIILSISPKNMKQ